VDRLSGDPNLPGAPYVIRIVNFDNQIVLPHRHPQDEHIVVLAGTWYLGQGERFDKAALQPLEPGDYGFVAKSHAHFAWSKGMTVIQVHGTGPFRVDFVDSAIVMSDSGAVVHIGNATRPITSSEAASRLPPSPGRHSHGRVNLGRGTTGGRVPRERGGAICHRATERAADRSR
jgi:hypothetical protein